MTGPDARPDTAAPSCVCPGKRTRHPGGDRRALERQPLRIVVTRNGRTDVLECGHELANPFRNTNHQRHCPACPPLAEPKSEVSRLRAALSRMAHTSVNASVEFARRIAIEALERDP